MPPGIGKGDAVGNGDGAGLAGSLFSSPKAHPPLYFIMVVVVPVTGSADVSSSY
jgi:hypothetical protein